MTLRNLAVRYLVDESGATAIEYGLIIALVGVGSVAGMSALGGSNGGAWVTLSSNVDTAMN